MIDRENRTKEAIYSDFRLKWGDSYAIWLPGGIQMARYDREGRTPTFMKLMAASYPPKIPELTINYDKPAQPENSWTIMLKPQPGLRSIGLEASHRISAEQFLDTLDLVEDAFRLRSVWEGLQAMGVHADFFHSSKFAFPKRVSPVDTVIAAYFQKLGVSVHETLALTKYVSRAVTLSRLAVNNDFDRTRFWHEQDSTEQIAVGTSASL